MSKMVVDTEWLDVEMEKAERDYDTSTGTEALSFIGKWKALKTVKEHLSPNERVEENDKLRESLSLMLRKGNFISSHYEYPESYCGVCGALIWDGDNDKPYPHKEGCELLVAKALAAGRE